MAPNPEHDIADSLARSRPPAEDEVDVPSIATLDRRVRQRQAAWLLTVAASSLALGIVATTFLAGEVHRGPVHPPQTGLSPRDEAVASALFEVSLPLWSAADAELPGQDLVGMLDPFDSIADAEVLFLETILPPG